MIVVCTYHIRRMSSLCSGSQHETEVDWMDEFEVTGYCVAWWHVSIEGHRQGQIKGCIVQCAVQVF